MYCIGYLKNLDSYSCAFSRLSPEPLGCGKTQISIVLCCQKNKMGFVSTDKCAANADKSQTVHVVTFFNRKRAENGKRSIFL